MGDKNLSGDRDLRRLLLLIRILQPLDMRKLKIFWKQDVTNEQSLGSTDST